MPIILSDSDYNAYLNSIRYHHGFATVKNKDGIFIAANESVNKLTGFAHLDGMIGRTDYELKCPAVESAEVYRSADLSAFESKEDMECVWFDHYAGSWEVLFGGRTVICNAQQEAVALTSLGMKITHHSLMKLGLVFHTMIQDNIKDRKSFYLTLAKHYSKINLTERQSQVLFYLIRGYSSKESARLLQISYKTVERAYRRH